MACKMYYKAIVFLLIMGLGVFLFQDPVFVSAETNQGKVVRVGYYENEIFQEGASEDAVKNGYAYEYYRKLSEYTGWRYEYVYGSYNELYKMLINGEIDLLAGLAYKEERADLIGYPDLAMGNESYNLLKHEWDESISLDPASLNGHTIGVLNSAIEDALKKYMGEHDIEATIVEYDDYTEMLADFDASEVEVLATEGSGTIGRKNTETLFSFGITDYYVCTNKQKPELLSELNEAQARILNDEPYYLSTLSAKYYASSVSARAFSPIERQWIEEHDTITIGYLNNYLPYSDTASDGETTGIIRDIMPRLFDSLGIGRIDVDYVGYDNYDDMIAAINSDEIDAAFPVGGGLYYSETSGIYQSTALVSSNTNLIFRYVVVNPNKATFAINSNNSMQHFYVKTNYPDAEVVFYNSVDECLDAVLNNDVDCTTLNGLRANDILKNSKYSQLSLRQLANNDDRCFGVKIGNEGLLRILNRGVHIIGTDYIENLAYNYTDGLYSYTTLDWVRDNVYWLLDAILCIALLFILLMSIMLRNFYVKNVALMKANRTKDNFIDIVANISKESIDEAIDIQLIEFNKLQLKEDKVDISEFINELGNSVIDEVDEKNITLTADPKGVKNKQIITDRARLSHVLQRIILEEVDYTQKDGHISIQVKDERCTNPGISNLTFIVSDDGPKVTEDMQETIIDSYIRKVAEVMDGTISHQTKKNNGNEYTLNVHCMIDYGVAK